MLVDRLFNNYVFYKSKFGFRWYSDYTLDSFASTNEVAVLPGEKILVYNFLLAGVLIKDISVRDFDVMVEVTRDSSIQVFSIFKFSSLLNFNFLVDIVSWDKPGERFRFSILYSFLSINLNLRIHVLCQTREGVPLESIVDLYESASWLERECWDMHGVYFVNHNNFLRLLTDYGFKGHPLRKDFPLSGFVELFYDDSAAGVIYEPVELVQEYRNFQFKSPWAIDRYSFEEDELYSDLDDYEDTIAMDLIELELFGNVDGVVPCLDDV